MHMWQKCTWCTCLQLYICIPWMHLFHTTVADSPSSSSTIAITVGSVCGAVSIILLVIIGIAMWTLTKRRRQRKELNMPEPWPPAMWELSYISYILRWTYHFALDFRLNPVADQGVLAHYHGKRFLIFLLCSSYIPLLQMIGTYWGLLLLLQCHQDLWG